MFADEIQNRLDIITRGGENGDYEKNDHIDDSGIVYSKAFQEAISAKLEHSLNDKTVRVLIAIIFCMINREIARFPAYSTWRFVILVNELLDCNKKSSHLDFPAGKDNITHVSSM